MEWCLLKNYLCECVSEKRKKKIVFNSTGIKTPTISASWSLILTSLSTFFFLFFFPLVCALMRARFQFMVGKYIVSGIMYIGRGCLGMERKRYVSKFNKRKPHCSRSSVHPNIMWNSHIHNRVHRLCWCTSWKYQSFVHGKYSLNDESFNNTLFLTIHHTYNSLQENFLSHFFVCFIQYCSTQYFWWLSCFWKFLLEWLYLYFVTKDG